MIDKLLSKENSTSTQSKETYELDKNESDYIKLKQWEEIDTLYSNELDDKIFIERAFYRSLIIINFKESLKILDGITISVNEISKSQKRIKKLKNILQKSLNNINEIDRENLNEEYKTLINKNKQNLINLLSTIDKDLNSLSDLSRITALNKSLYFFLMKKYLNIYY